MNDRQLLRTRSASSRSSARMLLLCLLAGCGPQQWILTRGPAVNTGRSGPPWTCPVGNAPCASGGNVNGEVRTNAQQFQLPECLHGIHQIRIESIDGGLVAQVQCAAGPPTSDDPLAPPAGGLPPASTP